MKIDTTLYGVSLAEGEWTGLIMYDHKGIMVGSDRSEILDRLKLLQKRDKRKFVIKRFLSKD